MDDEQWEPEEDEVEEFEEPIQFAERVETCPNCKKQFTGDLDCCPYCGDILFRHLKDGVFAPGNKWAARLIWLLIAVMTVTAILIWIVT